MAIIVLVQLNCEGQAAKASSVAAGVVPAAGADLKQKKATNEHDYN